MEIGPLTRANFFALSAPSFVLKPVEVSTVMMAWRFFRQMPSLDVVWIALFEDCMKRREPRARGGCWSVSKHGR